MTYQIISAEILDASLTAEHLVVEVLGEYFRAKVTSDMADTSEALPELVQKLGEKGFTFAGEPTDAAGPVELIYRTPEVLDEAEVVGKEFSPEC